LKAALEGVTHASEFAERAIARDSANDIMRRLMAKTYFDVGEVRSSLGAQSKASERSGQEQWLEARQAYQRSLDLFLDLRSRGTLTKEFAGKLDEIPRKIAACDAALAKNDRPVRK